MIIATGITKDYDRPVLRGIDLTVPDGQFLAVMGPSGSGKSTLLHMISGMDAPSSGSVRIDEQEITGMKPDAAARVRLEALGFVFQQPRLLQSLDLLDNVALPGLLAKRRPRAEVVERARSLLAQVGIGELARHRPTEVSGGQLQRAGIARALINEPRIVFGDEPTGALNTAASAQILDLLGSVHEDGRTLVLVTHDPAVAARAERVVVLVDGRIAADIELGRYDAEQRARREAEVRERLAEHGV